MIVRTVLGDIDPNDLGITYMHEHLIIDSLLVKERLPPIHLPSVDEAVSEASECVAAGVGTMVDAMPCASGRDVLKLATVASRAALHVVATTGLHTERYYEGLDWTTNEPPEVLADLFAADVDEGIDRYDYRAPLVRRTAHKAGLIKAATLGPSPDAHERRLFAAVAEAHRRTGAPILTHCEDGRGGLAQVELLLSLGVQLARVVLSHTDKVADLAYHRDLLSSGVNLEYDQALRQPANQPRGTAWLLTQMLSEGYGMQIMLGTDGARRSLWRSLGGAPGLAWLATGWRDVLARWGVDEATQRGLFVDNPARFLAFEPRR